jgi:hypothetical protein
MSTQRRKENDDRRVIERISNPHMRVHFQQLRWSLLFMVGFFAAIAVYNVVNANSIEIFAQRLVVISACVLLVIFLFRFYQAVMMFLENESSSNLDRVLERQSITWILIVFCAVISAAIHFIFR